MSPYVCASCGFWHRSYDNKRYDGRCTKCGMFAVELFPNRPEGWTPGDEKRFRMIMRGKM